MNEATQHRVPGYFKLLDENKVPHNPRLARCSVWSHDDGTWNVNLLNKIEYDATIANYSTWEEAMRTAQGVVRGYLSEMWGWEA